MSVHTPKKCAQEKIPIVLILQEVTNVSAQRALKTKMASVFHLLKQVSGGLSSGI